MRTRLTPATAIGAALVACGMIVGPAAAQAVQELTVTGRRDPDTRSALVSFADLDLRNDAHVETLKTRIRDTATNLCTQLGEAGPAAVTFMDICVDEAVRNTAQDVEMAVAMAPGRSDPALAVAEPYVPPTAGSIATDASATTATPAPPSFTTETVTNGPVPDTPENRARFGGPMSRAGQNTAAAGN